MSLIIPEKKMEGVKTFLQDKKTSLKYKNRDINWEMVELKLMEKLQAN